MAYLFKVSGANWATFFTVQQAALLTALLAFGICFFMAHQIPKSASDIENHEADARKFKSWAEFVELSRQVFSCPILVTWSVWYIVALAVSEITVSNVSTLFFSVDATAKENGIVIGGARLASALGIVVAGRFSSLFVSPTLVQLYNVAHPELRLLQDKHGLRTMFIGSTISTVMVYMSGATSYIAISYISYVVQTIVLEICFLAGICAIASR